MTTLRSKLPTAVTEGRGEITTTCVCLPLPRALLCSVLPRGLSLLDQPLAVLLLSRNHFTSWFGDMRYLELILGVPNVSAGDRTSSMYMRRLYLDQKLPQLLGNFIYGYEKLPARIRWDGLREHGRGLDALAERYRYQAEQRSGTPLIDAELGPAPRDASFAAGLARMWEVLEQPLVSQASRRLSSRAALERGGPFLRSCIRYDASAAVTRPVAGRIRFGAGFDPGPLAELELDVPSLGADGFGAAAWHTSQVVTLPMPIPTP
jgi:hypothetical protein